MVRLPMWAELFFCITETCFLYRPAEPSKETGQHWQVAHLGGGQYSIIGYTTGLSITTKNGSLVITRYSFLSGYFRANEEEPQAAKNKQRQSLYHQVIALHIGNSMLYRIPGTTCTFSSSIRTIQIQLPKYSIPFSPQTIIFLSQTRNKN